MCFTYVETLEIVFKAMQIKDSMHLYVASKKPIHSA